MKVIKFNTTQGQFYIPLVKVAEHRANEYYDKQKDFENWTSQVNYVMINNFEGIDWLINNSDFYEWADDAIKLNSDVNVLEDDFWCSSDDFNIIDLEIIADSKVKTEILNTINDLCSDFLYYDRKEDENLSVDQLNDAVKNKEITVDDMVDEFRTNLVNTFNS